jgi:hypothetical protein
VTHRSVRAIIWTVVITATVGIIGTAALPAKDVVEIRMPARYYSEPATVRIMIAVEPNEANRRLRVEADGDSLFRSSELPLEGENGKRLHTVEFKNLPAGNYVVRAAVWSSDDVRGSAQHALTVGVPGELLH